MDSYAIWIDHGDHGRPRETNADHGIPVQHDSCFPMHFIACIFYNCFVNADSYFSKRCSLSRVQDFYIKFLKKYSRSTLSIWIGASPDRHASAKADPLGTIFRSKDHVTPIEGIIDHCLRTCKTFLE